MMTLIRNPIVRAAAVIAVVFMLANPALTQQRGGGGGRGGGQGPVSVFAEPVRTEPFSNRVEAIGTLEANERADLTLSASDRVTAVYFEDGERVKAGGLCPRVEVGVFSGSGMAPRHQRVDIQQVFHGKSARAALMSVRLTVGRFFPPAL